MLVYRARSIHYAKRGEGGGEFNPKSKPDAQVMANRFPRPLNSDIQSGCFIAGDANYAQLQMLKMFCHSEHALNLQTM